MCSDAGLVTFVPIISPFVTSRDHARKIHLEDDLIFIEVFVATPLAECERRDPKGMYAQARSGKLTGFTGIDAPYEAPQQPDVVLGAHGEKLEESERSLMPSPQARSETLNSRHGKSTSATPPTHRVRTRGTESEGDVCTHNKGGL